MFLEERSWILSKTRFYFDFVSQSNKNFLFKLWLNFKIYNMKIINNKYMKSSHCRLDQLSIYISLHMRINLLLLVMYYDPPTIIDMFVLLNIRYVQFPFDCNTFSIPWPNNPGSLIYHIIICDLKWPTFRYTLVIDISIQTNILSGYPGTSLNKSKLT
jgi:hypothetical protein